MGEKKVVICGAGAIGCSTAYFLARRGANVLVIDRCGVACAASGKSGGFLAADWSDDLGKKGFELHEELASLLPVDYGYRKLDTLSLKIQATSHKAPGSGAHEGAAPAGEPVKGIPAWVDGDASRPSSIGTTANTAQVHPKLYTEAMMNAAKGHGAVFQVGLCEGIERSSDGKCVVGVRVSGQVVPADAVVIAMGPWSGQAAKWLPIKPILGQKAHSVTMRPSQAVGAHALFLQYVDVSGNVSDPEVYPRPDGEVYLCGLAESPTTGIPADPTEVLPTPGSCEALRECAAQVSSVLADATPELNNACFLPVAPKGLQIGPVKSVSGAYIAAGHSCWGILKAPSTGLALSELIMDGASKSVDLRPFAP